MDLTEPLFQQDWLSCAPDWWGIARFNKKTVLFYNVYRKAKRIIATRDICQFPCKITDIYVKRSFADLFCTGRVANKTNGMQPVFWDAATQRQYINLEDNVNRQALYSSTCYLVVIDEWVTSVDSWAANTFEPIASDNKMIIKRHERWCQCPSRHQLMLQRRRFLYLSNRWCTCKYRRKHDRSSAGRECHTASFA